MHSDPKKTNVQRRDHTNFWRNSRKRIAKFPKIFGTPRAEKLHKFGQRDCTNCRTSLQLFIESMCVLMQDNARVQRRDHAKFAQKFEKILQKIANLPEIRHAPRTKNCAHSSIVNCSYITTSLRLYRVSIAFRSEKDKRPASGSHKICAQLRVSRNAPLSGGGRSRMKIF